MFGRSLPSSPRGGRFFTQASERFVVTQTELLIIYTMLAVGSGIAGQDFLSALPPMLGHAAWFADGSNGWQDRERLPFPIVEIPLQMTELLLDRVEVAMKRLIGLPRVKGAAAKASAAVGAPIMRKGLRQPHRVRIRSGEAAD